MMRCRRRKSRQGVDSLERSTSEPQPAAGGGLDMTWAEPTALQWELEASLGRGWRWKAQTGCHSGLLWCRDRDVHSPTEICHLNLPRTGPLAQGWTPSHAVQAAGQGAEGLSRGGRGLGTSSQGAAFGTGCCCGGDGHEGCPAQRDVTLSLKNPTGEVAALTPAPCPAWVSPHMDMEGTVDLVSSQVQDPR